MEEVIKLLKNNTVMTLATSSNDKPRSSILSYMMVGDALIFSTHPQSIKGQNLSKNQRVSITVGSMPAYVAIDGTVKEPTKEEKEEYNKALMKEHPEFGKMMEAGMLKHFRVVFDTAYYTEGMGQAKIIKMK